MNSIKKLFSTYWLTVVGLAFGAIGGYLYYHFVGCNSGTCTITSKPLNSTLYGAMMGGLFFNLFKKSPSKNNSVEDNKEIK